MLKSINFGDTICFQYLNEDGNKNKIYAVNRIDDLLEFRFQIEQLYTQYLKSTVALVSFALDSKNEKVSVVCSVAVGAVNGGFSFEHPHLQYSPADIAALESQELYEAAQNALTLNSIRQILLDLSAFTTDHLAEISKINSLQFDLFVDRGGVLV